MTEHVATPFQPVAVRRYEDLIASLRRRRQDLGLSLNELDARAGFDCGYSAHLERWESRHGRGLGPVSLPLILEALGLAIVLVEIDSVAPGTTRAARLNKQQLSSRKAPDFGPVRLANVGIDSDTPAALLRAARAAIGMQTADVAKAVGMSTQTLSFAETGKRISDETWARLVSFYGASGVTLDVAGRRMLVSGAVESRKAA